MRAPAKTEIRVATGVYTALFATVSLLPSGYGPFGGWDASISPDLQDALHVPAYAALTVSWTLSWSTRFRTSIGATVAIAFACAGFGICVELAQYFIPGHACVLSDVLMNTAGAALGLVTMRLGKHWAWPRQLPCVRTSCQQRRERSWAIIRKHYHNRGWRRGYEIYESLLGTLVRQSSVVLDVGCGRDFPMAPLLLHLGAQVHGVDPTIDPQVAHQGVVVKRGLAEQIPYPDTTFDLVISRSVLEHLQYPIEAFREFNRVLKPGGRLLFLTANRYDYVSLIARAIPCALHGSIVRFFEGRNESDTFPTYYLANSVRQIRNLAGETAFAVERLEYLNHYPYLLTFCPFLCRLAIAYDALISGHKHLSWLQAWVIGVLRRTK